MELNHPKSTQNARPGTICCIFCTGLEWLMISYRSRDHSKAPRHPSWSVIIECSTSLILHTSQQLQGVSQGPIQHVEVEEHADDHHDGAET